MKYLPDGRKVSVVGNLNSKEYIVQEIYVKPDGSEIPAGENFVVKSLLDEPVISWKEKQTKRIQSEFKKIQQRHEKLEEDLNRFEKKVSEARKLADEKIKAIKAIASNSLLEHLETLEAFVNGSIKYVLIHAYSGVEIKSFGDVCDINEYYYKGIKLLSLFGDSDGNLKWNINQYKDGSGGWMTITPCQSFDEAVNLCQQAYDEAVEKWRNGSINEPPRCDFAKGCEIELAEDAKKFYDDLSENRRQKRISELKSELAKLESE